MAKITIDRGPAVAQALAVAPAAVNNISLTVTDGRGPIRLRGTFVVNNPAASTPTVTAAIRKNAVQIVETVRTMVMVASTRVVLLVEHVDVGPVAGDIYTLEIATSAVVAAHELTANQTALEAEGLSPDAVYCSNVGVAAA